MMMTKSTSKRKVSRQVKSKPTTMVLGSEINVFNKKEIIDKQIKLKKLFENHRDDPHTQYSSIHSGSSRN
jgi:hypothetical protein